MSSPDDPRADIFGPGGRLRLELFSQQAAASLQEALKQARLTQWDNVRSPHVFMGLLALPDPSLQAWADRCLTCWEGSLGSNLNDVLERFQELFQQDAVEGEAFLLLHREFLSDKVIILLREARQRAVQQNRRQVTSMDLLISLLSAPNSIVAECFERIGVPVVKLTEMAVLAEHPPRPD